MKRFNSLRSLAAAALLLAAAPVGDAQAGTWQPASLSLPSSGTYKITLSDSVWGVGGAWSSGEVTIGTDYSATDIWYWNGFFTKKLTTFASLVICNNGPAARTFDVKLYSDASQTTLYHEYSTFRVMKQSCQVAELNDGASVSIQSIAVTF